MFELGKILWGIANPVGVLFVLLCGGTALLFTRYWRTGRGFVVGVVLVGAGAGALPINGYLLRQLEERFARPVPLPERVDGILLLGGEVDQYSTLRRGEPVVREGSNRLLAFAHLARLYPGAKLVFTGGAAELGQGTVPEADAMPIVLRALGLDPDRVVLESRSRNTRENAVYSKDLVRPAESETWLMVTSAAHMPRAIGCFRRLGWHVVPYPVDYRGSSLALRWPGSLEGGVRSLSRTFHEFAGLLAYWLLGYTDELFPAP